MAKKGLRKMSREELRELMKKTVEENKKYKKEFEKRWKEMGRKEMGRKEMDRKELWNILRILVRKFGEEDREKFEEGEHCPDEVLLAFARKEEVDPKSLEHIKKCMHCVDRAFFLREYEELRVKKERSETMKCRKTKDIYFRHLDNALTASDQQHLGSCQACKAFLDDMEIIDKIWAWGKYPVPEGLEERLRKIPKQSKEGGKA